MAKRKKIFSVGMIMIAFLTLSPLSVIPIRGAGLPPVIDYITVTSPVIEGGLVTATVVATDPEGDPLTYTISDPNYTETAPGVFEWQTQIGDGGFINYNATVTVSDGVNSVVKNFFALVTDPTTIVGSIPSFLPPVPGSFNIVAGEKLGFNVTGFNWDIIPLDFTAANLPAGAEYIYLGNYESMFRWTPTAADIGAHPIVFSLSDGVNTDTANTVINVIPPANSAPVINNISLVNPITEGDLSIITVDATDADGDALTYSIDNPNFSVAASLFTWQTAVGNAGTYNMTVSVTDGVDMTTQNIQLVVNPQTSTNNPPVITNLYTNSPITEGGVARIEVTAIDFDGDPVTFSVNDSNFVKNAFLSGVFTWQTAVGNAGTYNMTVSVTDGVDTTTQNLQFVILPQVINNNPPVLDLIPDKVVNENLLLEFSVNAADIDGDPLTFLAANLPLGASFDPLAGTFSWIPTTGQAGIYMVTFSVTDGNLTDSQVVRIIVDTNEPPTLDFIPDKTVDENNLLNFTVTGSDPNGNPLTFLAANLPLGASFDPLAGTFSWIPTYEQAGAYNVAFEVSDNVFSDSQSVIITVNDINRPPVIESVPPKLVGENYLLTFILTGSDPDTDAINFSAVNLPIGATFDPLTRRFSWTPGFDQAGEYNVTFTVSDGLLETSAVVNISVINVNRAPVLDPIGTHAVTAGDLFTLNLTASDADGDALSFSAASFPTGAVFTDNTDGTSVFNWTPGAGDVGVKNITFAVTDGIDAASEVVGINIMPMCDTGADTSGDRIIDNLEILNYIVAWKSGSVSNLLILKAIQLWKIGIGC